MRKHPILGVLALALLLLASGAFTLCAGEGTVYIGADGECCVLLDGACVPCDDAAGTTSASAVTPTQLAVARFAGATTQLASVDCDPSQCEPMTPEECAAQGCDPGQCATIGSGTTGASAALITAQTQLASGCTPGPGCVPSPGCGSASSCGTVNKAMTLVGVRDAKTGVVTYYAMPVTQAKALLAKAETASPDTDI